VDYTTTALLASARRRAMLPSSSSTGTADADLLAIGNEELQAWLVPLLLASKSRHLIRRYTVSTTASTAAYRIPSRAILGTVAEVEIVTSSGAVRNLAQRDLSEKEDLPSTNGTPDSFYVEGQYLYLVPTPATAETLRISYFIRPNELVATSAVATISTINTGTGALTTSATVPGAFSTSQRYDLVAAKSGFEHLAVDLTASVASGTTVTFSASDLPSGLAAGDYICIAEQAPMPQVAADLHPLLAQRIAVKVLEALGDFEGMARATRALDELAEAARQTLAPRVDGETRVVAPGSTGLMGSGLYRWSW
jgi:hypothetical protein